MVLFLTGFSFLSDILHLYFLENATTKIMIWRNFSTRLEDLKFRCKLKWIKSRLRLKDQIML